MGSCGRLLYHCFYLALYSVRPLLSQKVLLAIADDKSQAPVNRKIGMIYEAGAPTFSPSESPPHVKVTMSPNNDHEEELHLENFNTINNKKYHRRSVDKSVVGGGVILGGLVTTFLVAIFCYIRATRRRNADTDNTY